jgi:hypothetical protein
MAYDKFLIGYTDNSSGFQSNLKPWLINDNAFEQLDNMYVLRGRLQKRFGTLLTADDQTGSRLRLSLGSTNGSGYLSTTVPGAVFAVGQMFTCGTDLFTVYQTGTPGDCLSLSAATCTYNTSTGAVVITGSALSTEVDFYPATPVMGLTQYYIDATNTSSTIAFDTQFAYQYNSTDNYWYQLSSGVSTWTGTDYEFFWSINYQGSSESISALWTTNFNPADGIRYWNNSTWAEPVLNYAKGSIVDTTDSSGNASGTLTGTFFIGQEFTIGTTSFTVTASTGALSPTSNSSGGPVGTGTFSTVTGDYTFASALASSSIFFTGNNYIRTAQIIVPFKNRMVLLNTVEVQNGTSTNYPFRARWCSLQGPLDPPSWMFNFPGNGNYADASTNQAIITAQFVKDRLIVYFEASTYELVYTNNQVIPFIWQKINNELGAVSTFSEIPFDKATIGIDDTGIHACNGSNVDRIDSKIPQYPFTISSENEGQDRVAGIRDYYNEMAYWSIPTNDRTAGFYFPNNILVYNYVNESWATITDSFTTFGYSYLPISSIGLTWGETITPWGQNINLWNANASATNNTTIKSIIAGNQEGFIQLLNSETVGSAPSLQITNFTIGSSGQATISCINHNLGLNQFVLFSDMNGLTFTDSQGNVMPQLMARVAVDPVLADTPNSFMISSLDNLSLPIITTGTYLGGGVAQLVDNVDVLSKQYNFYTQEDRNMYLARVDFLVSSTTNGQVTADYLVSSTSFGLVNQGVGSLASPGPLPGNSTLTTYPYETYDLASGLLVSGFEQYQSRLWHPVYMWAEGECVQLQLYMTINQMFSYSITYDPDLMSNVYNYVALNDFEIHSMIFYVTPTTSRMV